MQPKENMQMLILSVILEDGNQIDLTMDFN